LQPRPASMTRTRARKCRMSVRIARKNSPPSCRSCGGILRACRSKPPLGGTKGQEKDNAKSG
jgi:hypothetical protein